MSIESLFLQTASTKLRQSTDRIGICLGKLSDNQIWSRAHENENAVGNLVLHLTGNVRQWIVSGLGGKPDIRVRDKEFSTESGVPGAELQTNLTAAVDEAIAVIASLTTEQLTGIHQIQTRQVTGVEAVFGVVEHFGQHTGQIIYATKNLTGEDLGLMMPRQPRA